MNIVHVSKEASPLLLSYLKSKGLYINLVDGLPDIDISIRSHPDLYMCKLSNKQIVHCLSEELPTSPYPSDIPYNGVSVGNYFIHNLQHTANFLKKAVNSLHLIPINVKQGYTKCNMVVVDETSAITSDEGIYKTLHTNAPDLEILLIQPKNVLLSGHPYGFLGGASGRIGNTIVFHGDLSAHPNFNEIINFIQAKNLEIKYFPEFTLTDIGSIIEEEIS